MVLVVSHNHLDNTALLQLRWHYNGQGKRY